MEKLSFKLEQFEGPLDLLLHLISKHKLDICDIDISSLIDQYLLYIEQMQTNNLDIASEFLEMASRLIYMKSVMLLPKHEELEDLKQELQGQLLEYQLIKDIASSMGEKYIGDYMFVKDSMDIPIDNTYSQIHPPELILKAMLSAIGKNQTSLPPSTSHFEEIVHRPVVSVDSRIVYILHQLFNQKQIGYYSLFENNENKSEMVATFLAVLELIKTNRIKISLDYKTLIAVEGANQ